MTEQDREEIMQIVEVNKGKLSYEEKGIAVIRIPPQKYRRVMIPLRCTARLRGMRWEVFNEAGKLIAYIED